MPVPSTSWTSGTWPGTARTEKSHPAQRGGFTMPRFFLCFAVQKAAAARRKRLLPQAFCRHPIQHEGTPAPSYSPCEAEHFFSKQRFFDKLKRAAGDSRLLSFRLEGAIPATVTEKWQVSGKRQGHGPDGRAEFSVESTVFSVFPRFSPSFPQKR